MKKEQIKGYRQAKWYKRRDEILKRDNYTCLHCGRNKEDGVELQVHHLTYIKGHKPWEYPDYTLLTLCKGCHSRTHGLKPPTEGWIYDSCEDTEEFGEELTEKPVTLAIHEVAEGKLDANQMNLKVENAIG